MVKANFGEILDFRHVTLLASALTKLMQDMQRRAPTSHACALLTPYTLWANFDGFSSRANGKPQNRLFFKMVFGMCKWTYFGGWNYEIMEHMRGSKAKELWKMFASPSIILSFSTFIRGAHNPYKEIQPC